MFINYHLFFIIMICIWKYVNIMAWDEEIQALPSMKVHNVLGKFIELMHVCLHSGNIL